MSTLDSITATMEEHLTALQLRGIIRTRPIVYHIDIAQEAHDCLYNWIVDTVTSPGSIMELLKSLEKLKGFSGRHKFQDLVAITCLEGLAKRRPKVLEGSWEDLFLRIVFYFNFIVSKGITEYVNKGIVTSECINRWFLEYCSPMLCPNPCLRLELFRFMIDYDIEEDDDLKESFINTLYELRDRFSMFEINDIGDFSASDLVSLIKRYSLDIGNILNSDYPKAKKFEIIEAIVKITKMFVGLEKKRISQWDGQPSNLDPQMVHGCLHFFGLISNLDYALNNFAEIVSNNSILQEYVADTLYSLSTMLSKMEVEYIQGATMKINQIISSLVSAEARQLPLRLHRLSLSLCDRELNGVTPQIVLQMLYFTNFKDRDYIDQERRNQIVEIRDYVEENSFYTLDSDDSEYTLSEYSDYDDFSESSYSSDDE